MSSAERGGQAVPERAQGMAWQTIDGEMVLLNIDGEEVMGVNEVGARVWDLCDGARSIDQIVGAIVDEFEIDAAAAGEDVRRFLGELEAAGAIAFSGGTG